MCLCNGVERLRAVVAVAIAAETGTRKAEETNCKVLQRINILATSITAANSFTGSASSLQVKTKFAFSLTSVMLHMY